MPALLVAALLFQNPAPLPERLMAPAEIGHFHYRDSTKNKKAQALIDQGFAMIYGYAYNGARRSFQQAAKADPACAMAYYGIALADGPTINYTEVDDAGAEEALKALDSADKAKNATPLERELIAAQRKRFALPAPKDRAALNKAYADAMREVWKRHAKAANVGALFADALIDEHPWDQWTPDGQPKAGTEELMATLTEIVKLDKRHPHALHLYIHAYEASPFPEKALFAANGLENLQPGLDHMQHMPCHIFVHTGDWKKAVEANVNSMRAGLDYLTRRRRADRAGVFMDHVECALAYAAAMRGQSALAQSAIYGITKGQDLGKILEDFPDMDGEIAMPLEMLKRFGKWDQILAYPEFSAKAPISNAMRAAARGVAFAAKGDVESARKEQDVFEALYASIPAEKMYGGFDTVRQFLDVDRHLIAGEIAMHDGRIDEGIAEIKQSVEANDRIHYSEPPLWLTPPRHSLGAALIVAKRDAEAEAVYRQDLVKNPENGWALFGLSQALKLQGKDAEAEKIDARFKKAWADADIKLESSCLCLVGK